MYRFRLWENKSIELLKDEKSVESPVHNSWNESTLVSFLSLNGEGAFVHLDGNVFSKIDEDPSGHLDNYLHATVVVVLELFTSSS